MIATDGRFSMDGFIWPKPLLKSQKLAEK